MAIKDLIIEERARRSEAWAVLLREGGPLAVSPKVLRKLGIYGGAQGIWVDKGRTAGLTSSGAGIAVGILHTGSSYADDLSADGVLYHYPRTGRGEARDRAEIDATKEAGRQKLPIFVITYPSPHAAKRDVRLGWVEDWDDNARAFLISFGDEQPEQQRAPHEDAGFQLVTGRRTQTREVEARKGQPRFKFRVLARYGPRCAVCDLEVGAVLDAAHLCPDSEGGTDDPRNGLVLCAVHHRALDSGLFLVDPDNLVLQMPPSGISPDALRLTRKDLRHLARYPHRDALQWLWRGRRTDFLGCAFAGSQLQVQIYVNRRRQELNEAVCAVLEGLRGCEQRIRWVSPLEDKNFDEYWDEEALRALGKEKLRLELAKFWPGGGPHWDALAIVDGADPGVILVEAKSYPGEVFSEGTQAVDKGSRDRITAALSKTKEWLQADGAVDWTGRLYQSANRLAHLYFFRSHGVPAWLVNVYVCNTPEPGRCTAQAEWGRTIQSVKRELGLNGVVPYAGDVFLEARLRTELK